MGPARFINKGIGTYVGDESPPLPPRLPRFIMLLQHGNVGFQGFSLYNWGDCSYFMREFQNGIIKDTDKGVLFFSLMELEKYINSNELNKDEL